LLLVFTIFSLLASYKGKYGSASICVISSFPLIEVELLNPFSIPLKINFCSSNDKPSNLDNSVKLLSLSSLNSLFTSIEVLANKLVAKDLAFSVLSVINLCKKVLLIVCISFNAKLKLFSVIVLLVS